MIVNCFNSERSKAIAASFRLQTKERRTGGWRATETDFPPPPQVDRQTFHGVAMFDLCYCKMI